MNFYSPAPGDGLDATEVPLLRLAADDTDAPRGGFGVYGWGAADPAGTASGPPSVGALAMLAALATDGSLTDPRDDAPIQPLPRAADWPSLPADLPGLGL